MSKKIETVMVTGGAGYVGAVLVPKLLEDGYRVRVLDLYMFGRDVLAAVKKNPRLEEIYGDIRDKALVRKHMEGCDAVIHLACISNDPSFELNPMLGKSINYDAFFGLVDAAKEAKVKRFIYASSSSVYGVKDTPSVTEDMPLDPLTDYSKYKAYCEQVLLERAGDAFAYVIVRPATICGYSPRLRLDLTVNILTNHAVNNRKILVFGGSQMRPNLHIEDMCRCYQMLLTLPDEKIHKRIYNVGFHNYKVMEIAEMVRSVVGKDIPIEVKPTDDIRSYHVSADKIKAELGFEAGRTVEDAIRDLKIAFDWGRIPDSMSDMRYYNIKTMQSVKMS